MPNPWLPRKLDRLVKGKKRYKIIIGGRGSAKSHSVADLCLMDSQIDGLKVGCFREFQNSIEDSVYSLLKDEIKRMKCEGFNVLANKIYNNSGGEFKFLGLSRNPNAMKSMHGFKRFWVEEAQTISHESLTLLTPTLREDDSEIWMTANPMSSADPFSERFINPFIRDLRRDGYYEDDMHLIIVSNYVDNPFFPDVLEQERQFDELNKSTAEYRHIWLGEFNDEVEGSIIKLDWFNAAVDAHLRLGIEPRGVKILGHDPSDLGDDPKGLVVRHGSVITHVEEKTDGDINEGCDWATDMAIKHRCDVFRWDCDGLGVGLKRQISTALDGQRIDIDMFKGSETPDRPDEIYEPDPRIDRFNQKTNKETFRNKRAQCYWELRNRFLATYEAVKKGRYINPEEMISISSEISCMEQFRAETCRIPKKYNANGLIQIMSKDEMIKQKPPIKSPNLSDSGMMTMPGHTRNLAYQSRARPVKRRSAAGWT